MILIAMVATGIVTGTAIGTGIVGTGVTEVVTMTPGRGTTVEVDDMTIITTVMTMTAIAVEGMTTTLTTTTMTAIVIIASIRTTAKATGAAGALEIVETTTVQRIGGIYEQKVF